MGGRMSRNKGLRGEREFRAMLSERMFDIAWQAEDPDKPDVRVEQWNAEVKYRASVPKAIYDWLEEKKADFLAVRRVSKDDKARPWLAVCRMDFFLDLLEDSLHSVDAEGVDEGELYGGC